MFLFVVWCRVFLFRLSRNLVGSEGAAAVIEAGINHVRFVNMHDAIILLILFAVSTDQ